MKNYSLWDGHKVLPKLVNDTDHIDPEQLHSGFEPHSSMNGTSAADSHKNGVGGRISADAAGKFLERSHGPQWPGEEKPQGSN